MKQLPRLITCVLAGLVIASCSNPAQKRQEHFDNATKFMAAGKAQEAIVEYRNALRADGRFGDARFKLAVAYESLGNRPQAFREYIRAADLLPDNNEAQMKAAAYLISAGQFEDARSRLRPVLARDSKNVEAQLMFANALAGLKDLDGAVREIEEAIQIQPERGLSYSNLATVKMAQGQQAEAKAAFEKAVEVDPASIQARLALAYFQWTTGNLEAAETSLKGALTIDPKNPLANRTLATFYIGSNRAALAEPYLKALAESGNTPAAVLQLADYYLSLRRLPDAKRVLEALANTTAASGAARTRLAAIAYAGNDKPGGYKLVDAVIASEPNNVQALLLKSQWLVAEGKPSEALPLAQAAVKADPRAAQAQYWLGTVHDRLRNHSEAMAAFTETLKLNPRAMAAQVQLSRLNLAEGAPDKAVTFAEGALSTAPGNPDARVSLVRGLLGRRDLSRAEQELAPLIKQFPQAAVVHSLNGSLLLQKRDLAGSRSEFERAFTLAPMSLEALVGLTTVDLLQNKGAQALARIEPRLAASPNQVDLLMLAAQVHGAMRNFGPAEAALRKAIQNGPTSTRAYAMLAGVLLATGRLDAARTEYDQMAQRDPSNVAVQTMAAMIVDSQRKTAEAKKRYEVIVGADPTAAVAANNLAWIYQEEGDKLDEALRLAQGALRAMPDSAEVQDTLGMIYVKKELPALAIPAFEKSVEKAPDNPSYHYHLALALSKSGDMQRARAAAEQAVKLKPDYAEAQKLLAQTKG